MTLPPRLRSLLGNDAVRWVGFFALAWLMLRPALLVTISLDDFINPFSVVADYGASPFAGLDDVNRDVLRNGHFNVLGQTFGAVVFRVWTWLISSGIRYSFVYALTKLLVFVATAVAAARLWRTLAALAGREVGVWRSRLVVALVLFATVQLHVAWSLDPVGSFPLSGYLSVVVGVLALDVACRALATGSMRAAWMAAAAFCASILYYEANAAMVAALVPIAVLHARRGEVRPVIRRAAVMMVPPAVMTVVLQGIAAAANRGYTGTDVGVGENTPTVIVRTLVGSLPASAWGQARDWLGTPFRPSLAAVLCFLLVLPPILGGLRPTRASGRESSQVLGRTPPRTDRRATLLVALAPVTFWVGATLVQATTQKVRVETVGIGFVYNWYAYASVGVVLAALLVGPLPAGTPWVRRAKPALVVVAVVFVFVQMTVNDHVHREFGERLEANRDVLAAYTDEVPEPERCAALGAWSALPFWQPYYRDAFVRGTNASYAHFNDEPFCSAP